MRARIRARPLRDALAERCIDDQPLDRRLPGSILVRHEQPGDLVLDRRVVDTHVRIHTGQAAGGVLPELVVALAAMEFIVRQRRQADVELLRARTSLKNVS